MAAYEESVPQSHRPLMGHRGDRTSKEQRAVVESIREATGASVEDIKFQLDECGGDINKATELLITEPFTVVQSRKSKARSTIRERGRGTTARRGRPEENGDEYCPISKTKPFRRKAWTWTWTWTFSSS